jgi:hypothetical protein
MSDFDATRDNSGGGQLAGGSSQREKALSAESMSHEFKWFISSVNLSCIFQAAWPGRRADVAPGVA